MLMVTEQTFSYLFLPGAVLKLEAVRHHLLLLLQAAVFSLLLNVKAPIAPSSIVL